MSTTRWLTPAHCHQAVLPAAPHPIVADGCRQGDPTRPACLCPLNTEQYPERSSQEASNLLPLVIRGVKTAVAGEPGRALGGGDTNAVPAASAKTQGHERLCTSQEPEEDKWAGAGIQRPGGLRTLKQHHQDAPGGDGHMVQQVHSVHWHTSAHTHLLTHTHTYTLTPACSHRHLHTHTRLQIHIHLCDIPVHGHACTTPTQLTLYFEGWVQGARSLG